MKGPSIQTRGVNPPTHTHQWAHAHGKPGQRARSWRRAACRASVLACEQAHARETASCAHPRAHSHDGASARARPCGSRACSRPRPPPPPMAVLRAARARRATHAPRAQDWQRAVSTGPCPPGCRSPTACSSPDSAPARPPNHTLSAHGQSCQRSQHPKLGSPSESLLLQQQLGSPSESLPSES